MRLQTRAQRNRSCNLVFYIPSTSFQLNLFVFPWNHFYITHIIVYPIGHVLTKIHNNNTQQKYNNKKKYYSATTNNSIRLISSIRSHTTMEPQHQQVTLNLSQLNKITTTITYSTIIWINIYYIQDIIESYSTRTTTPNSIIYNIITVFITLHFIRNLLYQQLIYHSKQIVFKYINTLSVHLQSKQYIII